MFFEYRNQIRFLDDRNHIFHYRGTDLDLDLDPGKLKLDPQHFLSITAQISQIINLNSDPELCYFLSGFF